jgi:hypothetical protein
MKGFDWDLHNIGDVDRHGVDPAEVEEAVGRPNVIVAAKDPLPILNLPNRSLPSGGRKPYALA